MICKTCGKEKHYCSSCDYDDYLSEGFCNIECYLKSEEVKMEKGQFLNLLDRLDNDTMRLLKVFLKNEKYMLEDSYQKWIDERLTVSDD